MNNSLSWNDYGSEFLLGICVTDQRLTVLQLKETLPITRNRDSVLLPSSGAHRWLSCSRICCYADKVGLFVLLEQIYILTQYFVRSQLPLLKSRFFHNLTVKQFDGKRKLKTRSGSEFTYVPSPLWINPVFHFMFVFSAFCRSFEVGWKIHSRVWLIVEVCLLFTSNFQWWGRQITVSKERTSPSQNF